MIPCVSEEQGHSPSVQQFPHTLQEKHKMTVVSTPSYFTLRTKSIDKKMNLVHL